MSIHVGPPEYLYLVANLAALAFMARDWRAGDLVKPMNPWVGLALWVCVSLPLLAWGGLFDAPCDHASHTEASQ